MKKKLTKLNQIIVIVEIRDHGVHGGREVPESRPQVEGHGRHAREFPPVLQGRVRGRRRRRLEAHQPHHLGGCRKGGGYINGERGCV